MAGDLGDRVSPSPLRGPTEQLGPPEPPQPLALQSPHRITPRGSEDAARVRSHSGRLGCRSPELPALTFPLLAPSFCSRPITGVCTQRQAARRLCAQLPHLHALALIVGKPLVLAFVLSFL